MPRPNNGPQLSDEPNSAGAYEIRWSEGGRSKRRSTGCSDYRQAQQVYARFLLGLDDAATTAAAAGGQGSGVTVAWVCDYYLNEHVKRLALENTRVQLTRCLAMVSAVLGDVRVADLTDEHVRRFVNARVAGGVRWTLDGEDRVTTPVLRSTARFDISFLLAAIKYAAKDRHVPRDDVPALTLPAKADPREHYMTHEEAARLLASVAPKPGERMSRLYRLVVLGLSTAARQEAMLELTWDRVNFTTGMLDFRVPGRLETKKRRAVVPMSADLRAVLERAYRERNSEHVLDNPHQRASVAFRRALVKAGIKTPKGSGGTHLMRHTWASWQAQAGQSMTHIAAVLGDTVATTERHYATMVPETLRQVVNAVALPGFDPRDMQGVTPEPGTNLVQLCPTLSRVVGAPEPAITGKTHVG